MKFSSRKHAGRSVTLVMLLDPGYINWALSMPRPSGEFIEIQPHIRRLAKMFDVKPYSCACSGPGCSQAPTRVSVYRESLSVMPWCDSCSPLGAGADKWKIAVLRTFAEALVYVTSQCPTPRINYAKLVRRWAHLKGLPQGKLTERLAADFFA
jgi:hypothetical protein